MAQSGGTSDGQVSVGFASRQSMVGSTHRSDMTCGGRNVVAAIASMIALTISKRTFSIEQAA